MSEHVTTNKVWSPIWILIKYIWFSVGLFWHHCDLGGMLVSSKLVWMNKAHWVIIMLLLWKILSQKMALKTPTLWQKYMDCTFIPFICPEVYIPFICPEVYIPFICPDAYIPFICPEVYIPFICPEVTLWSWQGVKIWLWPPPPPTPPPKQTPQITSKKQTSAYSFKTFHITLHKSLKYQTKTIYCAAPCS